MPQPGGGPPGGSFLPYPTGGGAFPPYPPNNNFGQYPPYPSGGANTSGGGPAPYMNFPQVPGYNSGYV